jgi:hypothetical protein
MTIQGGKNQNPEQIARDRINARLTEAGRHVQHKTSHRGSDLHV